jgi:hypothetical protein
MGLLESTTAACYGVGFVLGGVLASLADPRLAITVAAVGVLLAAGAIVGLLRGDRRAVAAGSPRLAPQPGGAA